MKLRELKLRVRALSEAEQATIEAWRGTRAGSVRLRDRACIVALSAQGWWVSDIARIVRVSPGVVRQWITRFTAAGLDGLQDQPRSGRPATYSAEQIGEVIAVALLKPDRLGLPFGCWTLDRLAAYLKEERSLPIKRSRINELLVAEGLRWRTDETWFGERVDPQFAEKRGSGTHFVRWGRRTVHLYGGRVTETRQPRR
jgi:transposase